MKFSIVIPVRKINDFLRENIQYLKRLDYTDFEVIILSDEYEEYPFGDSRFQIIPTKVSNPSAKRNIGIKNSSGDIIAFLDDDAFPSENWLREAQAIFEKEDIYALGGPALTPKDVPFLEEMSGRVLASYLTSGNTCYRHKIDKTRYINDYPTVNLLVKKSALEITGGFNEEFWPGEDTKLCLDLLKAFKKPFLYSPNVVVFHHRRNLFIPHLKQVSRYGKHRGQFAKIFPENSRLPSYFVPSLFLLGLVFGPILGLLIRPAFLIYFSTLAIYIYLLSVASYKETEEGKYPERFLYMFLGIFLTHVVYGLYFIYGLLVRPKFKAHLVDEKTGNYIGG